MANFTLFEESSKPIGLNIPDIDITNTETKEAKQADGTYLDPGPDIETFISASPLGNVPTQEGWTPTEQVKYVKDYKRKFNMVHSVEDLEVLDVPSRVIANLQRSGYLKEEPLEGGVVLPFTPQWRLLNKAGEAAVGGAGKVISELFDMFKTRGMPQHVVDMIKNGSPEELQGMLKTLKSSTSAHFGDDLLGKNALGDVADNFFAQRRFFSTRVSSIESEIRKKTEELFPGSKNLQKDLNEAVQKSYKASSDKVNSAYKTVEDLGDDAYRYNVADMREGLLVKLREEGYPEPVIRNIKRNLFYIERNLTKAERGAQKSLVKLDDEVEQAALDMATRLPGKKQSLSNAEDHLRALRTTHPKSRSLELRQEIKALDDSIKNFKSVTKKYKDTEAMLPDFDEVGEKEFIRLIREVNRKKFIGGGDIGKYDMEEQRGLSMSKRYIENYFEKATETTNPGIAPAFKSARATYVEQLKKFGAGNKGNTNFPELGKMVEDKFNLGADISLDKQISSMMKSPYKLKEIGKILDKETPGMSTKLAEEWLNKELGVVRQGDRYLLDFKRVDLNSLGAQLDTIVSDPRKMGFIEMSLGKEKALEVESLHNVTKSLGSLVKSISKDGQNSISAWESIMQQKGGLGLSKVSRGIKLLIDKLQDTGIGGSYSREVMDRTATYIDRYVAASTAKAKADAELILGRYLEDALTGSSSKAFGRQGSHPASLQAIIGDSKVVAPTFIGGDKK